MDEEQPPDHGGAEPERDEQLADERIGEGGAGDDRARAERDGWASADSSSGSEREVRADVGPEVSGSSVDDFVREARRRKGLDPNRLSDLPDDPLDTLDPATSSGPGTGTDSGTGSSCSSGSDMDSEPGSGSGSAPGGGTVPGDDTEPGPDAARRGGGRVRLPGGVPVKWSLGSVRMGPLESGVAAVAEALASLEAPAEVDDDCLHERTVDLLRVRSLVDAELAGHVPEWNHRALWGTDGSKSPSARLARDANCAKGTAGGIVRQASTLSRMPLTREALADWRISTDHARRLVQACTDERLVLFLEAEAHLIGEAVRLAGDHKGFCRVVSHWEHIVDD